MEVNRISTPKATRDTGKFYFEVYKDAAFSSKIADLPGGLFIPGGDLQSGEVTIGSVTPAETGVQLITSYTIDFSSEHTLYGTIEGGSGVMIEFPASITLPESDGPTGGQGGSTSSTEYELIVGGITTGGTT